MLGFRGQQPTILQGSELEVKFEVIYRSRDLEMVLWIYREVGCRIQFRV